LRRTILVLLAILGFQLCGARQAAADEVVYVEASIGIGTLNGTPFTDVPVTISLYGDTANVTCSGGICENTVTLAVVSLGGTTVEFTDTVAAFDNQSVGVAGITDVSTSTDILDTSAPAFATYGLTTSIGPIEGTGEFNPGATFGTTGGPLIFTGALESAGFAATVVPSVAAPEPSSLLLLGTSIMGLGLIRRLRKI